jgi:NitT/TauT family transport system substrate-binding protein
MLQFAAKGAPLKAISALDGPPKMLVLVAPANKIKSVDDIKGKTVSITNKGSQTDWVLTQLAQAKGWSDSSITRAALGTTAARVAAMRAGAADAAVIDLAAGLALEDRGEGRILLNFGDIVKDYQNQIVIASDAVIKEKPEAVRQFLAALLETLDYARSHPKETAAFAEHAQNVSPAVAQKVYQQLVATPGFFTTDGRIAPATLKAMAKEFAEGKHLPVETDLSAYVNLSLLPQAK